MNTTDFDVTTTAFWKKHVQPNAEQARRLLTNSIKDCRDFAQAASQSPTGKYRGSTAAEWSTRALKLQTTLQKVSA